MSTVTIRAGNGPELPFPSPEATEAIGDFVNEVVDKRLGRVGHLKDTPEERARINTLRVVETDPLPGDEIRAFIERAEALEEQRRDLGSELKEIFAEAKGRGYDVKVLRKIIALRRRDADDVAEEEAILGLYKAALGMA